MKCIKADYYNEKIQLYEHDPKKLQSHLNKLFGRSSNAECLPQKSDDKVLADESKNFFILEVQRLNDTFNGQDATILSSRQAGAVSKNK